MTAVQFIDAIRSGERPFVSACRPMAPPKWRAVKKVHLSLRTVWPVNAPGRDLDFV